MSDDAVSLDEKKFALDAEMRRREMSLKEGEANRPGISPAYASVAGAVLALLGGVAGSVITSWTTHNVESGKSLTLLQIEELKAKGNLDLEKSKQAATEALERKKFETSLILDAIKTPSRADAIRNLKFFVAAGFVSDPDGRIAKLGDESLPSIGAPSAESASRALQSTGTIDIGGARCNGAFVSPRHVLTTDFCVPADGSHDQTIVFKVGERSFPLKRVGPSISLREQAGLKFGLALLEISSDVQARTYLDRTRARDPVLGERVYLAFQLPNQSVELRMCEVVRIGSNESSGSNFSHNCVTGQGSAGAIVIAVKDDAPLGLHHSTMQGRDGAMQGIGIAARIAGMFAELAHVFASASK